MTFDFTGKEENKKKEIKYCVNQLSETYFLDFRNMECASTS